LKVVQVESRERWGEKSSYFAVLTEPKFLYANLDDESLQDFFESGERHVEHVYSMNWIFRLLIEMQCSNLHVEFWEHQDFLGAMLYFERRARPLL
jgi:hypothetical protein